MCNQTTASVFLFCVLFLFPAESATAGIVVLSGSAGAGVHDDGGSDYDGVPWTQLGSSSLSAQWRDLHASALLEFAADDNSISLSFAGTHSVQRTVQESREAMSSSIAGVFWIMSDVDVLVSATGTMIFSLHGNEDPSVGMFVEVANQNQDLIHQGFVSSAYGPPDGMIEFTDSVLLNGGTQYFISAGSDLTQVAVRFSELPSIATSEMTIRIQGVPEPGAFMFLLIASAITLRRPSR